MIHAVIDTNVLVSVLLAKSEDSSVIKLIDAVLDGKIIPLFNNEIIAEYTDRTVYPESLPDEDDRVFYEVALGTDDAYLVTGNLKHFPKTPIVVTPAQMLDILNL